MREVEILRSLNPSSFKNSARESYRHVDVAVADDDDDGGGGSNGIINLIDFYPTPTHYRLVMELARGGDVFDRLAERKFYTEETARDIARSLFGAVLFLNERGISHRDIKPENLLLMSREDDARGVRLGDFGFARRFDDPGGRDPEASMSTRCGTPAFVPPELVLGRRYGPKCDMWSAGCTLVRRRAPPSTVEARPASSSLLFFPARSPPSRCFLPKTVISRPREYFAASSCSW